MPNSAPQGCKISQNPQFPRFCKFESNAKGFSQSEVVLLSNSKFRKSQFEDKD